MIIDWRMYYEDVINGLNEGGVRYLVVGGVALVLHGIVRLTVDFDLMLDLSPVNVEKFVSLVDRLGYKPKVPVSSKDFIDPVKRRQWINEKNMKVFSFYNPKKQFEIVDVFAENPIDFNKAYENRVEVDAEDFKIPLVSVDDLKKLKRLSGRPQDIADIEALDDLSRLKEGKNDS